MNNRSSTARASWTGANVALEDLSLRCGSNAGGASPSRKGEGGRGRETDNRFPRTRSVKHVSRHTFGKTTFCSPCFAREIFARTFRDTILPTHISRTTFPRTFRETTFTAHVTHTRSGKQLSRRTFGAQPSRAHSMKQLSRVHASRARLAKQLLQHTLSRAAYHMKTRSLTG
jgi:hypothetical protein